MHKRAVAAEGKVPIPAGAEGDEFGRIEIIGTARRGAEVSVVRTVAGSIIPLRLSLVNFDGLDQKTLATVF